jgi:hypothetical protein
MMIFNNANYNPERWQLTLLVWAFIALPVIWNVRNILPTAKFIAYQKSDIR